jgi:hypothetical protein
MAEEAGGFLGRWARRKTDVLQGKALDEPAPAAAHPPVTVAGAGIKPLAASAPDPDQALEQPGKQALTLDDARLLTRDSDFKPFMAGDVGPEVRNAAMKKLFADPHFNVMDGLDIYIDDYSKSDPIPESMLRQMASAKFLKLFDDDEDADKQNKEDPATAPRESANKPAGEIVAQSCADPLISDSTVPSDHSSQPESPRDPGASQENHAHTDLRLQPDHAAPAPDAGSRTQ